MIAFLAALKADSTKGSRDRGPDQGADEPAREAVQLPAARARDQGDLAGKKVEYRGVSGLLHLNAQGAPTSERYDVWAVKKGKPVTLTTNAILGK